MPGAVVAANPTTVMPYSLANAFVQTRTYSVDTNRYPDGSMQSRALVTDSRRSWRVNRRATAVQLGLLRAFYLTQLGPSREFYFYDPYETVPIFSYDNTGAAISGRYTVRFVGQFQSALDWGRNPLQVEICEVD